MLINIGYVSEGENIKTATLKVLKNKEVVYEKEYEDSGVSEMIEGL